MAPANRTEALKYHRLGVEQFKKGDYSNAVAFFDKAISFGLHTDADLVVYDLKALSLYSYGGIDAEARYDEAYAVILTMCKKWGEKDYRPWYRRAHHLNARGLYAHALQAIDTAFTLVSAEKHRMVDKLKRDIMAAREASNIKQEQRMQKATAAEQAAWAEKKRIEANATEDFTHLLQDDILLLVADRLVADNPSYACRLAAVCTRWRDVMYSAPAAWHTLELGDRRPALKVEQFARRSGGQIRKLKLLPSFRSDQEVKVAEKLKNYVAHLKSFEYTRQPRILIDEMQGRFDSLEELREIRPPSGLLVPIVRNESRRPDSGLVLTQPTLKTLVKRGGGCLSLGIASDADSRDVNLIHPWGFDSPAFRRTRHDFLANVETLDLRQCAIDSRDEITEVLYDIMPNLRECVIYDVSWQEHYIPPGSAVASQRNDDEIKKRAFENLISWKECGPLSNAIRFKDHAAPHLLHLEFSRASYDGDLLKEQLLAPGLADALPNLLSLDISRGYLGDTELLEVLKHLPSLRFLNVSFTDFSDGLLQGVTWDDERTAPHTSKRQLLPELVGLSIAGTTITSIPLRDFVLSRVPHSRIAAGSSTAVVEAPIRKSSFLPSASQSRAASKKPSQSLASGASSSRQASVSQVPSRDGPRAYLKWLCLDHIESIDPALSQYLSTKLPFVSHSFRDDRNEDRVKGQGRYAWDLGHYDSCAEEPKGTCTVKLMDGARDRYEVVHRCGKYDHTLKPEADTDNIWESQWDPYDTQQEPNQAEATSKPEEPKGWHKMDKEDASAGPSSTKRQANAAPESSHARVKARKGKGKISVGPDGSLIF